MSRYKLEVMLSEELLARLDAARLHEPRASFARRALEAAVDRSQAGEAPSDRRVGSRTPEMGRPSGATSPSPRAPEPEKPYELPKIAKRKW